MVQRTGSFREIESGAAVTTSEKTRSKKIDYGVAEGDHHTTVQSLYKMNVNETLDTVVSQLRMRFSENDLSPLLNIERL